MSDCFTSKRDELRLGQDLCGGSLDIETFGLSEIPLVDFKAALRYVLRTTQGPHPEAMLECFGFSSLYFL